MKTFKITEGECCICLEDYSAETNNECIQTICCKSYIHKTCIEQWSGTCPKCRGHWKEGLEPRAPNVWYDDDFGLDSEEDSPRPRVRHYWVNSRTRPVTLTPVRQPDWWPASQTVHASYMPPRPLGYANNASQWETTYNSSYNASSFRDSAEVSSNVHRIR